MDKKDFNVNFKHFLLYTVISFLALFIVSFSILILTERRVRISRYEDIKTNEQSSVNLGNGLLGNEFSSIISDLQYMTYVFSEHYFDENGPEELTQSWAEFSHLQGVYDQIRFIDSNGDEKIRINYSEGESYIIPEGQLQNKSNRYYYYETAALDEGAIYVSPLDLNVENGVVEVPYKPMIRLGTPVYKDGEYKGVIVLNYLAEAILDIFHEIAEHSERNMVLLNSEGYWLASTNIEKEWNFMFEDLKGDTFGMLFPEEWKLIKQGNGQTLTDNGLFTFANIDLSQKENIKDHLPEEDLHLGGGQWYVVSYVLKVEDPHSLYYDNFLLFIGEELAENVFMIVILLIISIGFGVLSFLYLKTYLKIKYYSQYDELTGVHNRHMATMKLDEMLEAKARKNFVLSICFLDVNGLKEVNDTLGHKYGDELLVTVADIIKGQIRDTDFVARMGGDEFLIAFARTGTKAAEAVWQRVLQKIDDINELENRKYNVSVSHGIVTCEKEHTCATTDRLIKEADKRMYKEKSVMKQDFNAVRVKEEK